jgi:hypothetical protein
MLFSPTAMQSGAVGQEMLPTMAPDGNDWVVQSLPPSVVLITSDCEYGTFCPTAKQSGVPVGHETPNSGPTPAGRAWLTQVLPWSDVVTMTPADAVAFSPTATQLDADEHETPYSIEDQSRPEAHP